MIQWIAKDRKVEGLWCIFAVAVKFASFTVQIDYDFFNFVVGDPLDESISFSGMGRVPEFNSIGVTHNYYFISFLLST